MSETETCPVTKLDTVAVQCLQALFVLQNCSQIFIHHTHGHSVIKTTTESFQRQQGSDDHSALSDLVAEMESVLRGFVKK